MTQLTTAEATAAALAQFTVPMCPYVPLPLTPPLSIPQQAFLWLPHLEAFYGGAAGGGKSFTLLAGALQWWEVPGYSALLVRRTYAELSMPGGLMDLAYQWLGTSPARWNDETKTWHIPIRGQGESTLTFGYLENARDKYRYQGAAFHYIGIDEVQQHPFDDYQYLLSRLRKPPGAPYPVRMRAAGNPPEPDQYDWPRQYFVEDGPKAGRPFIPARLEDNAALDQTAYDAALQRLDPVRYAQLRWGDWTVQRTGGLFAVDKLVRVPTMPTAGVLGRVEAWDKAGTAADARRAKYAKYTVGLRLSRVDRAQYGVEYIIEALRRGQWSAGARESRIRWVALGRPPILPVAQEAPGTCWDGSVDPAGTVVLVEREPADAGKESVEATIRNLPGVDVRAVNPTGAKEERARPLAAQMEAGNVGLVAGPWNDLVRAELRAAPNGLYWDIVDTASMGFTYLATLPTIPPPLAVSTTPDWAALGWRPL